MYHNTSYIAYEGEGAGWPQDLQPDRVRGKGFAVRVSVLADSRDNNLAPNSQNHNTNIDSKAGRANMFEMITVPKPGP